MRRVQRSQWVGSGRWTPRWLLIAAPIACGGGERAAADRESAAALRTGAASDAGLAASASRGEQLYQRCVTCHQANGAGIPGTFPPLAGSEFVTPANLAAPISIVLHGMQGPVVVKGTQYNGVMPAYGTGVEMSDEEVAAVLTYVRQAWGNGAGAVTPQDVARVRTGKRAATGPVTAEELKALM